MASLKKHIVHIRDSSGIFGAERVVLTLARNIDRKQFDFTLLCLHRNDGKSQSLISMAHQLEIDVISVEVRGRFDVKAIIKIRQVLTDKSVSIIHSHDFKSDFYGFLATLGTGIKRVITAHGSTKDSLLKRLYLLLNEKVIYFCSDRVIAVSEDLRSQLLQRGVPDVKIKVVQNGLDFNMFDNAALAGLPPESPIVIDGERKVFAVIGRLFPDKGHRFFLEAIAAVREEFPDICGLIVGDGPAKADIQQHIERLNLADCVILCGIRHDMKAIYGMVDFLVIPSLREGLPYVLLEAMASRVPVVASPVGDIPFLVLDGRTGFLVPPGNVVLLAKKMKDLLASPQNSAKMAEEAFAHVHQKFSATAMVAATERLYNEL